MDLGAGRRIRPTVTTEVEIRFVAESESRTRVELEHRNLDAYGDQAQQMQAAFDSPEDWRSILADYARLAAG